MSDINARLEQLKAKVRRQQQQSGGSAAMATGSLRKKVSFAGPSLHHKRSAGSQSSAHGPSGVGPTTMMPTPAAAADEIDALLAGPKVKPASSAARVQQPSAPGTTAAEPVTAAAAAAAAATERRPGIKIDNATLRQMSGLQRQDAATAGVLLAEQADAAAMEDESPKQVVPSLRPGQTTAVGEGYAPVELADFCPPTLDDASHPAAMSFVTDPAALVESTSKHGLQNADMMQGLAQQGGSESNLLLIQMPALLPAVTRVAGKDVKEGPATAAAATRKMPATPLTAIPSGEIGKMQVWRSGRITLDIGGVLYDVEKGVQSMYHQEAVAIERQISTIETPAAAAATAAKGVSGAPQSRKVVTGTRLVGLGAVGNDLNTLVVKPQVETLLA